jgi:hypothetical protein
MENIKCNLKKTNKELIIKIAKKRNMSFEKVKEIMTYNMFTIQQFSDITGRSVYVIHSLLRPSIINGQVVEPRLTCCYPFTDKKGKGPKFIVRDEKAENYIIENLTK